MEIKNSWSTCTKSARTTWVQWLLSVRSSQWKFRKQGHCRSKSTSAKLVFRGGGSACCAICGISVTQTPHVSQSTEGFRTHPQKHVIQIFRNFSWLITHLAFNLPILSRTSLHSLTSFVIAYEYDKSWAEMMDFLWLIWTGIGLGEWFHSPYSHSMNMNWSSSMRARSERQSKWLKWFHRWPIDSKWSAPSSQVSPHHQRNLKEVSICFNRFLCLRACVRVSECVLACVRLCVRDMQDTESAAVSMIIPTL